MKITIVGIGYVGLANGVLLAQNNDVIALDICEKKIKSINSKVSPINDEDIEKYLKNKNLRIRATSCKKTAYTNSDFIIICTPTDYDTNTNQFNTKSIEDVIEDSIKINNTATIIIKSTVPVGYTESLQKKHQNSEIIFSPEFLREGKALSDNLFPSRIIIGSSSKRARTYIKILQEGIIKKDVEVLFMSPSEAEAVKLFSNTFLAMRVAFFNELDSFSLAHNLDTLSIIQGVCLDPRIDDKYNNPSFGYGGYCLPKDSKQLLANYKDIPHTLIKAIVESNSTRKDFIANAIIKKKPRVVGIYRMIMKSCSDNIRTSSIQGIMERLNKNNIEMIIFEPLIFESEYFKSEVIRDIDEFKDMSDIILTNRITPELSDVTEKVFSRDLTGKN